MNCPICDKPSRVLDVRNRKNESRMRRRECSKCAHRFNSFELSEERLAVLLDYERYFLKSEKLIEDYR